MRMAPVFGMNPLVGALVFGAAATGISSLFELMNANAIKGLGLEDLDLSSSEGMAEATVRLEGLDSANSGGGGSHPVPRDVDKDLARVEAVLNVFDRVIGWVKDLPSSLVTLFGGPNLEGMPVDDAIITSEGQVIHTDPEDSIYAFKGDVAIAPAGSGGSGEVSMAPANAVRGYSGSPSGYGNQQSNVTNNVTNNYINQSNFNLSDLFPGSEFDPVGV
jgi:hypothetical protein